MEGKWITLFERILYIQLEFRLHHSLIIFQLVSYFSNEVTLIVTAMHCLPLFLIVSIFPQNGIGKITHTVKPHIRRNQ